MVPEADVARAARVGRAELRSGAAEGAAAVAGGDVARLVILVPPQAVLAVVHDLEGAVAGAAWGCGYSRGEGGEVGLAGVDIGQRVVLGGWLANACLEDRKWVSYYLCIAERREDFLLIRPCHKKKGICHLARSAVGNSTPR